MYWGIKIVNTGSREAFNFNWLPTKNNKGKHRKNKIIEFDGLSQEGWQ